ncbi:SDR family NAD(P)-dependent oxidoreductase [Shumkonia mesophila]|uniref:SDR family NAD(P)-dependent oxidoreductase n=1 Tax=Shumkonia mesophila TaxID=2838854 RepID=UPI00293415F7|nr:SDR family NAD(P)-dependent oxidoreductase [Shumkonia mesophila]
MTFEQQTAVVVGAARGIGRAVAERLAARGAAVAGYDRDAGALAEAGTAFAKKGLVLECQDVDITDEAAVAAAIERTRAHHSGIHILVNCAGITGKTGIPAHQVEAANFEAVLRINLTGAFLLTKAVVPVMLEQGYGRILHVASISGKDGNAGMLAYSASKAGLIGLVKSAGKDYAETGITINALAPAVILTDMVAAMPAHQVKYMTDKIPMKRTGKLEEAAAMIEWIVSPECSFTTGFCFDLSGGRATY